MRSQKKNVAMLCLFYFLSYVAFVLPYGYMQTFLEYVGYDVVERGIILSGTAVVAIITQFFIGYLCDKYKTDKKFFNLCLIVFVLSTLVMYQVTQRNFFLHLIFISLVGGMFRTTLAVQDTWTLETSETCRNNFGPIRAFGAIGWMIGSPIGALVVEHYGYPALGYVFAGLAVLNILLTMFMQDAVKVEKSGGIHASDLKELLLDKKYVVVVLIFLFINVIATADIYTTVDKMMALGAKEGMVGARWSIQAFAELPLFFAGTWLLKKFGDYNVWYLYVYHPLSGLCRCTESGNDDRGHADAVHHLSADHDYQQNTGGRYNTDSSAKQRADDRLRLLCGTFSAGHPGDSRSDGILPGGRFNTGADRPERICTAGTWYIIQTSGLTNVTGYHLLLNFCEKIVYNTN